MSEQVPQSEQRPLCLRDVHVQAAQRVLLTDTTVTIPGGKITVIVGGSGAGKSVLLRTLAGIVATRWRCHLMAWLDRNDG